MKQNKNKVLILCCPFEDEDIGWRTIECVQDETHKTFFTYLYINSEWVQLDRLVALKKSPITMEHMIKRECSW